MSRFVVKQATKRLVPSFDEIEKEIRERLDFIDTTLADILKELRALRGVPLEDR